MSARTLVGLDVLGAAPDRGLLIKINNIDDLVRAQGGATGALANMLLPDTISSKVYGTLKDKLVGALKDQGVVADVKIVVPTNYKSSAGTFLRNAAVGAAGVGVGWSLWHFVLRGLILGKKKGRR